jgi:hypothetical protein
MRLAAIMVGLSASLDLCAHVVGELWDCDDLDGPNVLMVMGYCHYTGGPFIGVVSIDPRK